MDKNYNDYIEIKDLSPKILKSWLDKDEAILVDVREVFEYKESYIEKAINIPLSQLLIKIHEITDFKNKKLVLQCKIGVRSRQAGQLLKNDGFEGNLWNLEGGIYSWSSLGYPTKSKNNIN